MFDSLTENGAIINSIFNTLFYFKKKIVDILWDCYVKKKKCKPKIKVERLDNNIDSNLGFSLMFFIIIFFSLDILLKLTIKKLQILSKKKSNI